jgi:Family of unknown function (DUF5681)
MKKKVKPGSRLKKGNNPNIAEVGKSTRFKPGQSGNPSGRPRDVVTQIMREMLPTPCPFSKKGLVWAEAIALAAFKRAAAGDVRAIAEVLDRTEGKPRQSVDIAAVGAFANMQMPPKSLEEIDRVLEEMWEKFAARINERKRAALNIGPPTNT